MNYPIINLLRIIINILQLIVFAHIILSWIRGANETLEQIAQVVDQLVEPIFRPLRKIVPTVSLGGMGRLDLTPLVAIIGLSIISGALP
ncbi:MAG: YggT family protein [Actinobacteria bacterium]|nr:MAG: YggT family protein [Actinomycetota bacterium]